MTREAPSILWLVALLVGFVALSTPLTLVSWHVLSEALAGRFDGRSLVLGAVLATLFAAASAGLGRFLLQIEHR